MLWTYVVIFCGRNLNQLVICMIYFPIFDLSDKKKLDDFSKFPIFLLKNLSAKLLSIHFFLFIV